jgi:hypothetical protein
MFDLLGATTPVAIQAQEGAGGVSTESILVFIGGVLAAVAAVGAALLTTRGAEKRQKESLAAERQRFDRQMEAETERVEKQFAHERYLVQRADASVTVEQVSRIISRSVARVSSMVDSILEGKDPTGEDLDAFSAELNQLREEVSIIAIRFGHQSQIVKKMSSLLRVLDEAFPSVDEVPLTPKREKEVRASLGQISEAEAAFLKAAKQALEEY